MEPLARSVAVPLPPEPGDEELVVRILDGEQELFAVIMRRYNQRLFRVARGVLDSDGEAEDVMQDAYVRAYSHLAEFRGGARFSTWLTKIALYEALARRRRAGRTVSLDEDLPAERFVSSERGPEARTLASELHRALESAVATLPESYRTVFLLREVEELSTTETADCLEISEEAVKVRLHRARRRLRDDLERRLGEATPGLFGFLGVRCDRVVAAVMSRLGLAAS